MDLNQTVLCYLVLNLQDRCIQNDLLSFSLFKKNAFNLSEFAFLIKVTCEKYMYGERSRLTADLAQLQLSCKNVVTTP